MRALPCLLSGKQHRFLWLAAFLLTLPFVAASQIAPSLTLPDVRQLSLSAPHVQIPMSFARAEAASLFADGLVQFSSIDSLWVCYTDYPAGRDFSQLNQRRVRAFTNSGQPLPPTVRLIRQTDCSTEQQARQLFHGLIVFGTLLPPPSAASSIPPAELKEKFDAYTYRKLGQLTGSDSSTHLVIQRGKVGKKKTVVIADWTGSMYPYTLQVLLHQMKGLDPLQIVGYVFFNDGDMKMPKEKVIGETGGLYSIRTTEIPKIVQLMAMVKKKGDGGELEENDMEALLYAQEQFPEADELLLIADNFSFVRDFSLAGQVRKPVRAILSRTWKMPDKAINQHYIQLAIMTNGSVHTDEADYTEPAQLRALADPNGFYGEK